METTKKTSTTKAALLVLAALSMLLSGLFIATASSSDAQDAPCPAGFTLSADGTECSQASAVTTFDAGNTCATGFLSPSGTNCWIEAAATDQAGTTTCPAGYSVNALNVCAANTAATASAAACPAGASGTVGSCYNVVLATSTPATATCAAGVLSVIGGVQTCLEGGANGLAQLQESCSLTLAAAWVNGTVATNCVNTSATNAGGTCDAGTQTGAAGTDAECELFGTVTTSTTVFTCIYTPTPIAGAVVLNGDCVTTSAVTPAGAATTTCPAGSTAIFGTASCLMPVANAATTYSCAAGTINVSAATPPVYTCDTTTGFSATPGGVLYICVAGNPAVVGTAVLCDLGAATSGVTTGPSCAQGVLSADAASCVVAAASAVAAPVPAFTG